MGLGVRRSATALPQESAHLPNLVIAFQRVMSVTGNHEGHFFPVQFHLEMILLGLLGCRTKPLEHLHHIAPVNVVRRWMREELFERELGVRHTANRSATAYGSLPARISA